MSKKALVPIELPADPTNALEAATKQYVDAHVDITGALLEWPLTVPPAGYLKCDGTTYNDSAYPTLAALLKTEASGIYTVSGTQFKVPDIVGRHTVMVNPTAAAIAKTVGYTDGDNVTIREDRLKHVHGHNITSTQNIGRATDAATTGSAVRLFGPTDQHGHVMGTTGLADLNYNIHAFFTITYCIKT